MGEPGELERTARDAVVIIAGLVDGARKYTWYTDTDAGNYLDQVDQAIVKLASVLPENRETWACEDCGWCWPLPGKPPEDAECDNCGGELAQTRA